MKKLPYAHCYVAMCAGLAMSLTLHTARAQAPDGVKTTPQPTAADKETARALLAEGRAKFASADNEGARKAFVAAHAIMGVPTTGIGLAQALAALGQLIEAREVALDILRMPRAITEPEVFTNARTRAAELTEALATRIPSIVITVKGLPEGLVPDVKVDGVGVAHQALGLARKANPGKHEVVVSAPGFITERREVLLDEGASTPLGIVLSRTPQLSSPTFAPLQTSTPSTAKRPDPPSSATERLAADSKGLWIVPLAAGVGALAVAVGFGIDHGNVVSTVTAQCPNNICNGKRYTQADLDALQMHWDFSLGMCVGLSLAGATGIGAGLTGMLWPRTAQSRHAKVPVALTPWISPDSGGLIGSGSF